MFDLYATEGGGQTIYQQIIQNKKDCTFYYLRLDEKKHVIKPDNVIAIPFHYFYAHVSIPGMPGYIYEKFHDAMDMAKSVQLHSPGIYFDYIDTPDYNQNGIFIGQALQQHGICYGSLVLAMHGALSTSFKYNWPSILVKKNRILAKLRHLENLQYQTVDHRYAISIEYANQWDKKYKGLSCTIVDPLVFLERPRHFETFSKNEKIDIYCVCRKERRKGPDIFIDLMWFLNKDSYNKAYIIGDEDNCGRGSKAHLEQMATLRDVSIINLPSLKRDELMQYFNRKAINVVSSRYESLSLSALESLLHGCPTLISRQCGVTTYLKTFHPNIPFYEIDNTCAREGAAMINHIIQNYDEERIKLIHAIHSLPAINKEHELKNIYVDTNVFNKNARDRVDDLFLTCFAIQNNKSNSKIIQLVKNTKLRSLVREILGNKFKKLQKLKWILKSTSLKDLKNEYLLKVIAKLILVEPRSFAQWCFAMNANGIKRRLQKTLPEKTKEEIQFKIQQFQNLVSKRYVDRSNLYNELATLEEKRNNPLISAVYQSRIMRWQGRKNFFVLDRAADILKQGGYQAEADVLPVIYGKNTSLELQKAYLQKKLEENLSKKDLPFELIDDRRTRLYYKVSVIISLYSAANKMLTFIKMITQQTIYPQGTMEIIFVDSGSPTNEYEIFKQCSDVLHDVIYVRSQNRETIQCAWNRGIKLARGEYVNFIAADEGLHPDCLEILVNELDKNADVDWVMGNAFVAEIDKKGQLYSDIMPYNRNGGKYHSHLLDCTYINYTPGLYRKSVHEKYGYYDETFSAAGDTEFKNRVLPFINIKFIPRVLGSFNNYQEVRTTAHPRAEIEDTRAWYLFRTPGGVAYIFQNKSEADLIDLLKDTLGYRKAFCGHLSTDIELGLSVCTYLYALTRNNKYKILENFYKMLIEACKSIEMFNSKIPFRTMVLESKHFNRIKKEIAKMLEVDVLPKISIFHDNRYEQHWWPWG